MSIYFMQRLLKRSAIVFFTAVSIMFGPQSAAAEYIVEKVNPLRTKQKDWVVLPYAFSSDSMGFTAGAAGIFSGFIQPQMSLVATVLAGEEMPVEHAYSSDSDTERAVGGMLAVNGYNPSFSKRTFISAVGVRMYNPKQRLYLDGGHDTRQFDGDYQPLESQGHNNWADIDFRYVLPWGESRNTVLPVIKSDRGIAVNRGDAGGGAPFSTGQTIIGTEFFYAKLSADKFAEQPSLNTNGMRLYIEHDNTDYAANPSRGYRIKGKVSADFGLGSSTQSWNAVELDSSYFLEMDNFSWTRQQVLAFNVWTAYSPSWDKSGSLHEDGVLDKNQTPMWEGARLGGLTRMRAYDSNRFNDKAAVYGSVEYRLIPSFNPMKDQGWSPFSIDWFQTVLFVEAGRVAEQYELGTLLSDMKYDVGFSLRALAANVPVRFDIAVGDEGTAMQVMINQPF
ncbi:BamA/TamA family outer membrane protein [Psychromonas aquimarina]|uniref:BamA/TamA family outer membrane protein n=1 Tax=Psychromonas aquimarina TaxID=444919 RepID=UPI000405826E|nr:BamA/TamA family outer membrane protein [Psychromonas aquimarina]